MGVRAKPQKLISDEKTQKEEYSDNEGSGFDRTYQDSKKTVRAKRPKLIETGYELAEKIIHLHREGKLQEVKAFLWKAYRENRHGKIKNVVKALYHAKFSKLTLPIR